MTLRIHDTLSRRKVDFQPLDDNHVKMYVCGPTVYDYAHIGNARPVIVFDVMARLLRKIYPKVSYVRNITDVDDKINARARESGEDIRTITERTVKIYREDMAALGAEMPDVEPRATEHITPMIEMIQDLIAKGHAYANDGHVLFSVPSMPDYGKLSKLDKREIIAGARVEIAPYKNDAQDFVLWKPSDPETPGWDSPWGRGRPGWHIECSAMSKQHLGDKFDIHGGGQDLIFPHHENEIAQSKCSLGHDAFATYWMHNGYLMSEGEKMSKSLGNFYTVHELLEEFPGEAIRLLLLKTHYRQPLDFTKDGLREAKAELDRFYGAVRNLPDLDCDENSEAENIQAALSDDLNTPQAIARLHEALNQLNRAEDETSKQSCKTKLLQSARLLGLLQQDPEDWFRWQPASAEGGLSDADIDALINERAEARKAKDFARSDEIRDQLTADGIVLEDSTEGTIWRRG
jgi:cysteinyl-tRNA synthetase